MAIRNLRHNFQTISWFWDLFQRDRLDLDPPYQRRSVWNQDYKDYFIDTVLLGYPTAAIFLYEEFAPSGSTIYRVVDGKQRLTSIFEFVDNYYPVADTAQISRARPKQIHSDRIRTEGLEPFQRECLFAPDFERALPSKTARATKLLEQCFGNDPCQVRRNSLRAISKEHFSVSACVRSPLGSRYYHLGFAKLYSGYHAGIGIVVSPNQAV